jgi:hypothetical protein
VRGCVACQCGDGGVRWRPLGAFTWIVHVTDLQR